MYTTKYFLRVRDKQNWARWVSSKEYDTIEELFEASKQFLLENPGRVISFMQRRVFEQHTDAQAL